MARIIGLDGDNSCPKLLTALKNELRVCDEAFILPHASRSIESGAFKNVVMRLAGQEAEQSSEIFSSNWYTGVSMLAVPAEVAEPILARPEHRADALKRLRDAIPSEMADSEIQVGPPLDGDETDRDTCAWTAGFDSSSCLVGLYSARQSRAPEHGIQGMDRAHTTYFLICKAGGGTAAQTFHTRLCSALGKGMTLDQALETGNEPGPQSLRRVSLAGQRNRHRILAAAADAIGYHMIDTISDNAAFPGAPTRKAIPSIDVTYNSLRKVQDANRSTWQYAAGCLDGSISQGVVTSSNLAEGFVLFTTSSDDTKVSLRNEAHNAFPFVTQRLESARNIATKAADAHKAKPGEAHPDNSFVRDKFTWKSKEINAKQRKSNGKSKKIK